MDFWSKQQTRALIYLYREHPCLYDPNHKDFLNKQKRNESFTTIIKEIKHLRSGLTMKLIKSKIKTLINQMRRENARIQATSKQTGTEVEPTFWCYNDLLFLKNIDDRSAKLNQSNLAATRYKRNTHYEGRPVDDTSCIEVMSSSNSCSRLFAQKPVKRGREEVFCDYLCSELKQFKLDNNYNKIKWQILNLVLSGLQDEQDALENENLTLIPQ